jgi:hypothetical protein
MTSFPSRMVRNIRACSCCLLGFCVPCFSACYGCRYKFQSSLGAFEDKTAVLSDTDTVWTDVRHMHMREAIDKLMADFNKFMTDNAGFKGYVRLAPSVSNRVANVHTERVQLRSMI